MNGEEGFLPSSFWLLQVSMYGSHRIAYHLVHEKTKKREKNGWFPTQTFLLVPLLASWDRMLLLQKCSFLGFQLH